MIKLNLQGMASDYTEYGSVSTDYSTVGEFMTQAAAIYGGNLTIKVDGFRYEFSDTTKIRVTDDTPIDEVLYLCTPGGITFIVKTKPKPKTVKKSGWVNIYKTDLGNYCIIGKVYSKESECHTDPARKEMIVNADFVTTAKVEWEEVQE